MFAAWCLFEFLKRKRNEGARIRPRPLPHNYIWRYLAGEASVSGGVGRGSWNDSGISRAETLATQARRRQAKARSRILILGQIISRRENFCAYH